MRILTKLFLLVFLVGCGNDIDETTVTRFITIHGEVLDTFNAAVEDAEVLIYINNTLSQNSMTDSEGLFSVAVDVDEFDGLVQVQIRKEGYAKVIKSIEEHENDVANVFFTLHRFQSSPDECNGNPLITNLVSVKGRIIDQDAKPGKGSVTFLTGSDPEIIAYTDKEGFFEALLTPSVNYEITYNTRCISQKIEQLITDTIGTPPEQVYKWLEFTNSFNDDFILPAYVVNEPLQEFRINGTAKRCDGTFVTNGKVIFADFFEIPITDGKIDHHTYDCFSLLDNHTFVVEDYDTQKRSELMIRPVVNNVLEMGEVLLCEDLDHSIQLTIDDEMLNLKPGYMMKSIWMFADIFSNADNVNYLISTAGSDVGSYECFVEIKEEGRPDLILRNTNESTVEFVSFDFDNFYGLSQGNLNGEFTDVMTNKAFDISGTFKVRNIPDFGTY